MLNHVYIYIHKYIYIYICKHMIYIYICLQIRVCVRVYLHILCICRLRKIKYTSVFFGTRYIHTYIYIYTDIFARVSPYIGLPPHQISIQALYVYIPSEKTCLRVNSPYCVTVVLQTHMYIFICVHLYVYKHLSL